MPPARVWVLWVHLIYWYRSTSPRDQILRVLNLLTVYPKHKVLCLRKKLQPTSAVTSFFFSFAAHVSSDKASSAKMSWISKELLFKQSD